jgi:uncharacterized protein
MHHLCQEFKRRFWMANLSNFIKRHPLIAYFVLAFAIAWGIIFIVAGSKGFRADTLQLPDIMLMFLGMLLGPSLAGISLTAALEGKQGLRSLLARRGHWRLGPGWYAVVLLFPVLIFAVLILLSILVSAAFTPGFAAIGLVVGLVAGFFEEIGWTGFALPRLRSKHSLLTSGLILGLLWGFWHIVADYFGNSASLGALWLPYFLFGFVAAMTATRILIAWVYDHTRSILLAQLMHASSTGFLAALGISAASPSGPSGYVLSFIVYAVALWVVVVILVTRFGKRAVDRALRAQAAQALKHSS